MVHERQESQRIDTFTPDNKEGGRNLPTPFVTVMSDVLFAVTLAAPMLRAVPRAPAVV
jgi:hypothetical protein